MTPRKEMADICRGTFHRVMETERIEEEHGIIEIKLRDELLVLSNVRWLLCVKITSGGMLITILDTHYCPKLPSMSPNHSARLPFEIQRT